MFFPLHMHAKPSFTHRLQTAKMASSRTSAQSNGPRAQKMTLGCKIISLGWNVVKCLTHDLRDFNGAVQRRLATLMATMLISSRWQLLSKVKLRRIFDVCKRWANSGSHEFVKKNMVRYMRPHEQWANRPFWPLVSKYTIFVFND